MTDGIDITHGWRPGLLGEVVAMHARAYARDWGFGPVFEAGVAADMAEFLARHDPATCRLFHASTPDGRFLGSLTIDGDAGALGRLFALLEQPDMAFNIVEP